jgi:hypothetical protein
MRHQDKRLIFKHYNSKLQALLLIFIFPLFTHANSRIVKGYIISQNNDTLSRQVQVEADIFGQFNEIKLYHEVDIIDEKGNLQTLSPTDIKGFGFSYKDKQYAFISKPMGNAGRLLFVEPLITGRKATLYLYKELSYMTNEYHFTLEKQDGTYLSLSDFSTLETFREKLKSFFGDNKDALSLIENSFRSHSKIEKDMAKVVQEVNNDKKSLVATTR